MKVGDLVRILYLGDRPLCLVTGYLGRGVNYDIYEVMFIDSGVRYPFPEYRLEKIKNKKILDKHSKRDKSIID